MSRLDYLHKVKRIVVKVGSNSLTTNYTIDKTKIKKIVNELSALAQSYEILLVSSGAIAAGRGLLGFHSKIRNVSEKQAAASIGQIELIEIYKKFFNKNQITISQILLTEGDFADRQKYLNARNAFNVLLKHHVLPIVNENDTVGISEIIFGDNDMLSALIAILVDADLLIILSDVDGLLDFNKKKLVGQVEKIDDTILSLAQTKKTKEGRGGMVSKLKAIEAVMEAGKLGIIANSQRKEVLSDLLQGKELGTFFASKNFLSDKKTGNSKKKWIRYSGMSKGILKLDNGAVSALRRNKSLLATGIKTVEGFFNRGDVVTICDERGKSIGRGIVNYSSKDVELIKGKKTSDFEKILGFKLNNEIVHKDNFVLLS